MPAPAGKESAGKETAQRQPRAEASVEPAADAQKPALVSAPAAAAAQSPAASKHPQPEAAANAAPAAKPAAASAEPRAAAESHAAAQKAETKEAVKLVDSPKPAQIAAQPAPAPARDSAPHASAPAAPAPAAPAPAAARIDALAYDPSLRMTMKPGEARVSLDAGGGVSLHVQVQNGVANVRAEGAAAPLLAQNLPELRASLASNGLSLGGFERGDSKEREQPEEAEAPTSAGKPIANVPSRRSSKSRLEVEA
ncbi:MAG TPA: hypothetical protein VH083_03495 [Myxococcales bacterium]|nr:hypothetical protein [Myxococcales bacterium]